MNTLLSTPVDEQHQHEPHSPEYVTTWRRVGFADRVALHLGLALITWSRRSSKHARHLSWDELRALHSRSTEQAKREWQAERTRRLTLLPR